VNHDVLTRLKEDSCRQTVNLLTSIKSAKLHTLYAAAFADVPWTENWQRHCNCWRRQSTISSEAC